MAAERHTLKRVETAIAKKIVPVAEHLTDAARAALLPANFTGNTLKELFSISTGGDKNHKILGIIPYITFLDAVGLCNGLLGPAISGTLRGGTSVPLPLRAAALAAFVGINSPIGIATKISLERGFKKTREDVKENKQALADIRQARRTRWSRIA